MDHQRSSKGELSPAKVVNVTISAPNRPSHDSSNPGSNESSVNEMYSGRTTMVKPSRTTQAQGFTSSSQQAFTKKAEPRHKKLSRKIVENSFFVCFTMVLTIYALVGDDVRILVTHRSADSVFNWIVVVCLAVFTFECILSVFGKADYLYSFFFWLDLISTASLILDITVVADQLMALSSSDDEAGATSDMRGGRAAKIGAKAGRVVRVLRLVRILKLYKAYYEARAREKKRRMEKERGPADEDDWDDEEVPDDAQMQSGKESQVGKKLSEVTTRRVICLILAMLLGLPILQAETADQAAFSANYGAERVWMNLKPLVEAAANSTGSARITYERALLHYVYYHNWFAQRDPSAFCPMEGCSQAYYAHLFWVGIEAATTDVAEEIAQVASLSDVDVNAWEASYTEVRGFYNFGTFPPKAQQILKRPWNINCDHGNWKARGISLLSEEIDDVVDHLVECPKVLRSQETLWVTPKLMTSEEHGKWHLAFYFDLRPFTKMDAVYNLLNTLNILVLLVGVSLMFSNDANRLIVNPVERMIKRVEAIRDDPLVAMRMADDEFKAEEIIRARKKRAQKERIKNAVQQIATCTFCSTGSNAPMETVILEKTIIKLGSLLALGFGEAGANIIGHNMKSGDSSGVNAMIPGTRVDCIIGVARVRDFSTATEVLQSKIMTFVNQIAEIVHGVVQEFLGAPNRNSGESFLIIWRIEGNEDEWDDLQARQKEASRLAGLSVCAFAKILGALHRSTLLATYRGHPGLQYRLGAGCRVNLSFGLHAGWAIEGAVGSEFKIDASYLSPNVSIAMSVERATDMYNVSLLVAQSVVELCHPMLVSKCRLIDNVIIVGSAKPMELHCVDLDYRNVVVDNDPPLNIVWNTRNRFKVRQFLESEKAAMECENLDVAAVFDSDSTIRDMRRRYTVEFFQLFNMGYQNYSQGEWQVARRMLSCTRAILGAEDGPSSALLRHMEAHQFDAPREWQGVRELCPASLAAPNPT